MSELKHPRRSLFVGCLCSLIVGGLIATAILADRMTPNPIPTEQDTPVLVPVVPYEAQTAIAVSLEVIRDAPAQAVVRQTGILTKVSLSVGDLVKNGQVVARVDDRPLIAMVTADVLSRDLASGDHGNDVKLLQIWLQKLGYYAGDCDGHFRSSTREAMRNWQRHYGERETGRFELGSVIWVGEKSPTVAELRLGAGQSVNSGDALFTAVAQVRSIKVVEPPGGIKSTGSEVLTVGEVKVPYLPGSAAVTKRADAIKIAAALGVVGEGLGRVEAVEPVKGKLLPASAVITDAAGRTCVFGSVTEPATLVSPSAGGLGGVIVSEDFPLTQVLANPSLVRAELSCG